MHNRMHGQEIIEVDSFMLMWMTFISGVRLAPVVSLSNHARRVTVKHLLWRRLVRPPNYCPKSSADPLSHSRKSEQNEYHKDK